MFDAHHGRFGCRRIGVDLNETGWPCSVGLIADIMRDLGLKAVQPRAYRVTTRRGEDPFPVPDLLGREFTAGVGTAGDRLVGDITYLRTGQGWLYLATVIDLGTRMVVGQLAEHMRTSLVVDAMQMAIDAGRVNHDAIFHSDRGTPIHLEGICRVLSHGECPPVDGAYRGVLGQRRSGIILRHVEERNVLSSHLPYQGPGQVQGR